jgi:hypothetical protein
MKIMSFPWFKKNGIFYIPVTIMGWIILFAGVVCLFWLFIDIDSRSHSASDTLRPFVIWLIILGVVYTVIGYLTSNRK